MTSGSSEVNGSYQGSTDRRDRQVLTFKVGLPLSAAKIPRMMTTKTKTTPSKICAKHLNYYIINISNRGFEIIIDINIDLFLDKIISCDDSSKKSC